MAVSWYDINAIKQRTLVPFQISCALNARKKVIPQMNGSIRVLEAEVEAVGCASRFQIGGWDS